MANMMSRNLPGCLGRNYIIWNFLDCNNPGGNFLGGNFTTGIFFGGGFPVGNCPGENHPGGSFPRTGNPHGQSYGTPSGLMLVKFWVSRKSTIILILFYSHLLSVYSHLQLDGNQNALHTYSKRPLKRPSYVNIRFFSKFRNIEALESSIRFYAT